MSDVTKNVFNLKAAYELITAGQWVQYDNKNDPGTVWVWGSGEFGRLGNGATTHRSSPVQIPGNQWNNISTGFYHAIAKKTDGTLWVWGYNAQAQLGDGTTINRSSPVQIPGNQWNNISAGVFDYSLATKTDGTLWAWGSNGGGKLGDGTTINRSSPVQIPGNQWNIVSAGAQHSLATKTDGTLWAWGCNYTCSYNQGVYSLLGDGSTIHRSSPVQVSGTGWNNISAGVRHSLATKIDGSLWSWGTNYGGTLGINYFFLACNSSSVPIRVPGNQWNNISAGTIHSLATKTDATLWSWGSNYKGQLGAYSYCGFCASPIQISGNQWVSPCTRNHTITASKSNGTLWGWGSNYRGAVGDGTTIDRSSPVQIPGTSWISGSVSRSAARKT